MTIKEQIIEELRNDKIVLIEYTDGMTDFVYLTSDITGKYEQPTLARPNISLEGYSDDLLFAKNSDSELNIGKVYIEEKIDDYIILNKVWEAKKSK